MSDYIDHIIDMVEEMREENMTQVDKLQIFAAPDVYRSLEVDSGIGPAPRTATRLAEISTMSEFPTHPAVNDAITEVDIGLFMGETPIFEEYRCPPGEVTVVDPTLLDLRSGTFQPVLRHPMAFRRHRFIESSDPEESTCVECGEREECYVEGDNGEIYCSLSCLYEGYQ